MQEHHIEIARTARYVTLGPERGARELWIVCHGYGQLAQYFARHFQPLDDGARRIVAPEGLSRFYLENPGGDHRSARVGATWMTRDDRLVDIGDYVRYLDTVYDTVARAGNLAAAPLTVLGFSQGVATVCRWSARGVPALRRLILWGERLPPDLDWGAAVRAWKGVDLVRVAGDKDPAAAGHGWAADGATLDSHGLKHRSVTFTGGHHLDADVLRGFATE